MSRFPVRMAWRETRGGSRHLLPSFACIALGVAALTSVGGFAADLDRALAREAKALIGGDLELRSARPPAPEADAILDRVARAGARVTRVRELAAMLRTGRGRTLLVELKAVEDGYPLYGHLETSPSGPPGELLRDGGALVDASLLARLDLVLGDVVTVGDASLTISGIVVREPDRAGRIMSLGPRVLVAATTLDRAGLIRPGSRVRYRALLRLPDSLAPAPIRETLARDLADPAIRVVSYDETQPGMRRFFGQLTTYLGLVGLTSLLVGGIGVASAVTAFLRRRRATIAILKCLGATSGMLLAIYLLQALALGVAGSLAGVIIGVALEPVLPRLLDGLVPFSLEPRFDPWTTGRGLAMGGLTTLLCALWPLLEVRRIPPSLILRQEVEGRPAGAGRPWLAAVPIAGGLAALAVWQAGSIKVGAIFVAAAAAAVASLAALAWGVIRGSLALPRGRGFAWRQGVAGLHRPGGHAAGVIVALGVGVMLLVAVALLEESLGRQIDYERRREAPSFFFVDVQPDQRDLFTRILRETSGVEPTLYPVVRSRLAGIKGAPLTREMIDRRREQGDEQTWYLTREYVLTWAESAPAGTVLTRGRWWTREEAAARPRVSVEEEAARSLRVGVGDGLTFDIQGVRVDAEVMSLRRVDWQSLSANFFVVFTPGALDSAPSTYVATARVPASAEAAVQDAVVAALPNVAAVPVRDVLERVGRVMDQIAAAIRVIALFSISAGLVVMAATLAASRYQRVYESVILRTLGATRATVARAFAVEYACLGLAAGVGGALLASILAWIVLRFVLDAPWRLAPAALALGVALATLLALAVGFLATFRLLGQKPLPVLRQE